MPALEAHVGEFLAAGAVVLGISCDSTWSHEAWARQEGITYPLLSDLQRQVCQAYGVFNPERNAARRSTFIIDRGGVVRFREVYAAGQLPEPARLLEAVRALSR